MQLFVVGGKDFTNHITVPSYKVNKEPVTETWTDANYVDHSEVIRTRISGNFKLLYDDVSELDEFFDTIEAAKAASDDGTVTATLYLNNKHTVETAVVKVSYSPANEKPNFGREKLSGFEVTIKER